MRYVFISDVHGQYHKMLEALDSVGFNAEKDTIVNIGDPFDRGPESKEVLDYLMNCPNRILIWGNHDARLYELTNVPHFITGADFQNGINETLKSLTRDQEKPAAFCDYTQYGDDIPMSATDMLYLLRRNEKFTQYINEAIWAIEFPDLVVAHAWVPYSRWLEKVRVREDWRNATWEEWYDCSWGPSRKLMVQEQFIDKPLLIGHWWAFDLAEAKGEKRSSKLSKHIDCSTFVLKDEQGNTKLIAIDGCSNWEHGGKVNAYVYESDVDPIKYRPK